MINLPFTSAQLDGVSDLALTAGVHIVTLAAVKMVQTKAGEDKLVVEYTSESGAFSDWLGFKSVPQAGRTFAYICRLHELAGLPAPKGGSFDEAALLAAGNPIRIEIQPNDKGYLNMVGFPEPASAASGEPAPF